MIETINDIIDNGAPDSDINALRAWKADLPMKKFVQVDALIRRLHQCPHKNTSVLNAQSKADADSGEFRAVGGKTYVHRGYPSMSNPSRDEAPGRPWASYRGWTLQASVMWRSVTSRDTVPPEQTPYDSQPESGPKRFV
jgi:D-serine deaminase-like pyridoxal phosphate-dependent protein